MTTRSRKRASLRLPAATAAIFGMALQYGQLPASAATAGGTIISNTASATYSDANGNSYTTNSNTVTTTVQNVPALTVTANLTGNPAQTVGVGNTVADPFTLTNTGNSSGNFQLSSAPTPVSDSTLVGYVVNAGAGTGNPCTYAAPCTLAAANTYLNGLPATASGGTVTVAVVYVANPTQTTYPDPTTQSLAATITSNTADGANATTSAVSPTAIETDSVQSNARLDLTKSVGAFTGSNPIPFTISANNGGAYGAQGVTSVDTLLGIATTNPGIVVTDKIPSSGSPAVPLLLNTAATFTLPGGNTGATGTVYYATNAAGTTWTTAFAAGTTYYYVALFIAGGANNVELVSAPGGSTVNAGVPTVTTPQATLNLVLRQPTGGATIANIANSVIGGNPNAGGPTGTPLIGPTIPIGTVDSPTVPLTGDINNASAAYNAVASPGGASNIVSSSGATPTVLNGPAGNANVGATGIYPGSTATTPTNNLDYTAVGAKCSNVVQYSATGAPGGGPGATCTPTGALTIPDTFENTTTGGSGTDTFALTVTAPAGYTAQAFQCNGSGAAAATSIAGVTCAIGSPLTSVTVPGGTITSSAAQQIPVASGAFLNYVVVYTPVGTAVQAYTPLLGTVTVAGQSGTGTGPDANTTNTVIYAGGVLELNKTQSFTCPNTAAPPVYSTSTTVAPGCRIAYVVTYINEAAMNTAGTEPAFADAALTIPTGMTITEDGGTATASTVTTATTVGGNNWYQFSGGLLAAPTVTGTPTFGFNYFLSGAATSQTTFPTTTPSTVSKFTAVSTSTIAPGVSGTITFSVQIN